MKNDLTESILKVCDVFAKHSLEYMIVGGAAVALHGFFRWSSSASGEPVEKPDLDFWYNPTYENYSNLLRAIEDLGQDVSRFKKEKSPNPRKSFFRLDFKDFTMDLLPEIIGLEKFYDSYRMRDIRTLEDIDVDFIALDDLIINKETTGRAKDLRDVEELKLINKKSD